MDVYLSRSGFELKLQDAADVELGYYTAAVGDGSYRFKDRLAWGYSWHECGDYAHDIPYPTKAPCTFWLFLDANTGEMLEEGWQQGT